MKLLDCDTGEMYETVGGRLIVLSPYVSRGIDSIMLKNMMRETKYALAKHYDKFVLLVCNNALNKCCMSSIDVEEVFSMIDWGKSGISGEVYKELERMVLLDAL